MKFKFYYDWISMDQRFGPPRLERQPIDTVTMKTMAYASVCTFGRGTDRLGIRK